MNAMDVIPYEENSFYIFDRGYNDFERLFRFNAIGAHFKKRKFTFFTNTLDISPMMVAELISQSLAD